MQEDPPTDPPPTVWTLLLGGVVGNVAAAVVVLVAGVLGPWTDFATALVVFNIGLIPVLVGLVAAWFWRRLPLTLGEISLHAVWVSGLGLAGAMVVFREGFFCLLIAFPLHFGIVFVSLFAGHCLFRTDRGGLRVSVLPLAVVLALAESRLAPPPPSGVFTDELHIAAPPAAVWPHVVAFAPIPAPADFWVFRLGLPYPVETPSGADAVGKERLCIFSGGVIFRERVTVFEPGRRLVFDIIEQPRDPELLGHFDTHRGEFELRDEGDGTTTLIGRSTYTLYTRPHWYFDWWTRYLGRAVHRRVMENARRLAESR